MAEHIKPAEPVYAAQVAASGDPHHVPAVLADLQAQARQKGLWNLFLPHPTRWSAPLNNLDYAPLGGDHRLEFHRPRGAQLLAA